MLFSADIYAQKRTDINPGAELDTTFIYNSPRPLVSPELTRGELNNAGGVSLLFSRSGFGVGGFYNRNLSENTVGFISLYISGARNTDEFEVYNYNTGEYFVPGKINRLFNLPLMFGAKYMMFGDALAKSFRPYVSAGAGPSLIMSTPYEQGWFEAWGDVKTYIRPSGFVGLGAYVGGVGGTLLGVNARYYYIPFGGDGLESIKGQPIKDFGGVFLSLSLGARY
ncbi:MAG: hypothetical protein ACLFQX_10425 [Candidatus Kapaibacterium sp.]